MHFGDHSVSQRNAVWFGEHLATFDQCLHNNAFGELSGHVSVCLICAED
jgi:hypothetical protein